jgi:hypothetical protein
MEKNSMFRSQTARWWNASRALAFGSLTCLACEEKAAPPLAPVASAALAAPVPAGANALKLAVVSSGSSVRFLMDSPLEKIDGDAPGSVSGVMSVDLSDLAISTALVKVDLDKLTLYQQKRADSSGAYGERKKSDLQNEHARDWLQIVPRDGEVTEAQAAQHKIVEFRIERLSDLSATNVRELKGPERKVTATATGDFRLHGRQAKKSAKIELTFAFAGDKFESVRVKSLEPVPVKLAEFEVHPRDAAGKFVQSITETVSGKLKGKVQNEAPVSFEFTAK